MRFLKLTDWETGEIVFVKVSRILVIKGTAHGTYLRLSGRRAVFEIVKETPTEIQTKLEDLV